MLLMHRKMYLGLIGIPVPCVKDVGTFHHTPSTVPHLSHIQIQTLFQLTPHPLAGPCPPVGPYPPVQAGSPSNHPLEWTGSGGNIKEGSMFFPSSMFPIRPVSTDRKEKLSILQACLPAGHTAPMPSDHRQWDISMLGGSHGANEGDW